MDRKQRIEMMLRVLLCPFLELHTLPEDPLYAKAKAYCNMVTSRDDILSNRHTYEQMSREMERWLELRVRPERLSEMESLLEMFYPQEELRTYLLGEGHHDLDDYYIQVLFKVALEFIATRNGQISICMWNEPSKNQYFQGSSGLYKVELWSVLSRIITPDVIIAAYFVANEINDVEQLAGIPENLSLNDALFDKVANRGIAETHMHLGAGMSYLTIWQVVTDPFAQRMFASAKEPTLQTVQREEQRNHHDLLICGWLRLLMARYLEDKASDKEDIYDYFDIRKYSNPMECRILHYMLEESVGPQHIICLCNDIAKHRHECMYHLSKICPIQRTEELDVLLRGPYQQYQSLQTEPEVLLLYFALYHIRRNPDHHQFTRIFLNYIRMKNNYFRDKLQVFGGKGLLFFTRYFHAAASAIWQTGHEDHKKEQMVYQSAFRNQLHCANLKKLEVKISPRIAGNSGKSSSLINREIKRDKRNIAQQLSQIFTAYLHVCREKPENSDLPCLGIVYHFIKKDIQHPSDYGCWVVTNRGIGPTDEVSILRMQCVRFLQALRGLIEEVPFLDEYVVGLDAASQELKAEPWVYAPVYRFARSQEKKLLLNTKTNQRIQSIGLTYHVGEDYHHVLTGLRHIDEVITYFGYKAGDRLGHAMALQVDLELWIHDHETIPVPSLNRLEDLLWMWSLCEECPEELGKYRFELEGRLMKLATQIFRNIKGLNPYVLWNAYTRKFDELDSSLREGMKCVHLNLPTCNIFLKDSFVLENQRPFCCQVSDQEQIWDSEKLLLTNYCPIYTRYYHNSILISTPPEDLPMLQSVQRYVRKKVQTMGVFVETNPTSNISIGDISSLRDYPITRLNTPPLPDPDPMSILLSINSDDPLVFNTNVENELALVYHTLIYRGYGREEVLNWIDKVRQYGMDSSFIHKQKNREQMLQELDEIVYSLNRMVGLYSTN